MPGMTLEAFDDRGKLFTDHWAMDEDEALQWIKHCLNDTMGEGEVASFQVWRDGSARPLHEKE